MYVFSFLAEVEVEAVAQRHFMLAGSEPHARGVGFVRIAEVDAVEAASYESCHGVARTVAQAHVELLLLMRILQSGCDVGTKC